MPLEDPYHLYRCHTIMIYSLPKGLNAAKAIGEIKIAADPGVNAPVREAIKKVAAQPVALLAPQSAAVLGRSRGFAHLDLLATLCRASLSS